MMSPIEEDQGPPRNLGMLCQGGTFTAPHPRWHDPWVRLAPQQQQGRPRGEVSEQFVYVDGFGLHVVDQEEDLGGLGV